MSNAIALPPAWHVPAGWTLTEQGMSCEGMHAIDAWVGLDAEST